MLRNKYFIPTKFHQNQSSGSGEEIENVKSLQMDGRVDGQKTAQYDNSLKLSLRYFVPQVLITGKMLNGYPMFSLKNIVQDVKLHL